MTIFNIPRAGRREEGYVEHLIFNMYYHPQTIFKEGFGVCDISVEKIIDSFEALRKTYCKINQLKIHCMEIIMDSDVDKEILIGVANRLGELLFEEGFQSFCSIFLDKDRAVIVVAVSAVSYKDGKTFYDNNNNYYKIYQLLNELIPEEEILLSSKNSFFDPQVMNGNYIHGAYV